MVRVDTSEVFLECQECMSGFRSVVAGRVEDGFWVGDVEWDSRPAEFGEMVDAGLGASVVGELAWIGALSDPRPLLAVYGDKLPSLGGVRIEELSLSPNGPTVRLRLDLKEYPIDPPMKWQRDGLNVVHVELLLIGLEEISISEFSVDSVCDLKIWRDGLVRFSGESGSVRFQGAAAAATVVRISAYATGSF